MAECEIPVSLAIGNEAEMEIPETEITIVAEPLQDNQEIECVVTVPSKQQQESQTLDAPLPTETDFNAGEGAPTSSTSVIEGLLRATPHKQHPRRSFTTEFKLECVEHAEKTKNKTETARVFNVNRRRVQEWCLQKKKLMSTPKEQKRLSGGGRRQVSPDPSSKPSEVDPLKPAGSDYSCATTSSITPQPDESKNDPVDGPDSTSAPEKQDPPLDSETDRDKSIAELSQVLSMYGTDATTPDALADNIVRGLSSAGPSILSPSLIKIIQEVSLEVMAQDSRGAAAIRDATVEMLTPKEPSDHTADTQTVETKSTQDPHQALADALSAIRDVTEMLTPKGGVISSDHTPIQQVVEVDNEHQAIADAVSSPQDASLMDTVVQSDLPGANKECLKEMADPKVQTLEPELGSQVSTTTAQPVINTAMESVPALARGQVQMDVTMQAAILDALMHVATSVQLASTDILQSAGIPITTTSNIGGNPEPSVQAVAMEINSNGKSLTDEVATPMEQDVKTETPTARNKVKKVYSLDFKLDCVAYAESTSKCAAAREFKVDRRRVQDWCSQKEKLQQLKCSLMGVNKSADLDIEKQLAAWVKQEQEAGKSLTRKMVGEEAMRLFHESGNTGFIASIGWVAKFMVRNGISLISPRLSRVQPSVSLPNAPPTTCTEPITDENSFSDNE